MTALSAKPVFLKVFAITSEADDNLSGARGLLKSSNGSERILCHNQPCCQAYACGEGCAKAELGHVFHVIINYAREKPCPNLDCPRIKCAWGVFGEGMQKSVSITVIPARLYSTYQHSEHEVVLIPTCPSFLIVPLFIATIVAVIVHRRKRLESM